MKVPGIFSFWLYLGPALQRNIDKNAFRLSLDRSQFPRIMCNYLNFGLIDGCDFGREIDFTTGHRDWKIIATIKF